MIQSRRVEDRAAGPEAFDQGEATKYRQLYESMRDAFVSVDMQGHILEFNSAYMALTGYTAEELPCLTYVDLTPDRWHAMESRIVEEQVLRRGYSEVYEKEYRRKDGRAVPIELRTSLLRNEAQEPVAMWAIIRDISDRKQLDAQLQAEGRRYRMLFEQSADAIVLFDPQTLLVRDFNEQACRQLGYTRDEFARLKISDLEVVETADDIRNHCTRVVTEDGDIFETRHRTKSGATLDIEVRSKAIRLGERTFIHAIWRDITHRKALETELRRHRERLERSIEERTTQLAASEARFDRMAAYLNDVLYGVDIATGEFEYLSTTFTAMFGYSTDDITRMGGREKFLAAIIQDGKFEAQKDMRNELSPVAVNTALEWQAWWRCKDGSLKFIEDRWIAVVENGQVRATCGVLRDLTMRKRAEESVRSSEARYRLLFDAMSEGFVLHELVYDTAGAPCDLLTLAVNPAFERQSGISANSFLRLSGRELFPDAEREWLLRYDEVLRTGESTRFEAQFGPLGRWFDIRAFKTERNRFAVIFSDITERKRNQVRIQDLSRVQNVLSGIHHAMAHVHDRTELLNSVCRTMVECGAMKMAWAGLLKDQARLERVAFAGQIPQQSRVEFRMDETDAPEISAITKDRLVLVEGWRERGEKDAGSRLHRFDAAALPIRVDGRPVGVLAFYTSSSSFFDDGTTKLLRQVGDEISFALTAMAHDEQRDRALEQLQLRDAALAAAANGIAIVDRSGTIVWVNRAFADITGYAPEEAVGQNPRVLKSNAQGESFYAAMWETILAGRVWRGELVNRRKDGSRYDENMTITPVRGNDGEIAYFIAIKQDVTARKKMEREMMTAVEREQARIGQDIHDGLCQILTGAKFRTALLGQKLQDWSPVAESGETVAIESLIDQAIEQARGLAHGLNPLRPDPDGLQTGLEHLADSVHSEGGPHCICVIPTPVPVQEPTVALHLYRIAQEAVQNALRHGTARNIRIELTLHAGQLSLAVIDDGIGVPDGEPKRPGNGISNMRMRAGMIGGCLEISKPAGGGTAVVCRRQQPTEIEREP